jgi:DNA-directed RNA polymerase subunit K/omega
MNQLIEHENHLIQQFLIIGFQEIKDGIVKIGILNKYPNNEISYLNILDEIIINVIKFFYN